MRALVRPRRIQSRSTESVAIELEARSLKGACKLRGGSGSRRADQGPAGTLDPCALEPLETAERRVHLHDLHDLQFLNP